jgi:hypothetical protein
MGRRLRASAQGVLGGVVDPGGVCRGGAQTRDPSRTLPGVSQGDVARCRAGALRRSAGPDSQLRLRQRDRGRIFSRACVWNRSGSPARGGVSLCRDARHCSTIDQLLPGRCRARAPRPAVSSARRAGGMRTYSGVAQLAAEAEVVGCATVAFFAAVAAARTRGSWNLR